jgi:hypothetical protein
LAASVVVADCAAAAASSVATTASECRFGLPCAAISAASWATSDAERTIVKGTSTMRRRAGATMRSRSAVCSPRAARIAFM